MESRNIFDGAVRVKEEPIDESLIQNHGKMIDEKPDIKNFQLLAFPSENSINILQKCDIKLENELDDGVEIVVECEDVKPKIHLLTVKKVEEESQNFLRDMKDTDGCKTHKSIRIETAEEAKPEIVGEQLNMNIDCELVERNKKRRIAKELNNEHNPKTQIATAYDDTTNVCEMCGKKFSTKSSLNRHVKALHDNITHSCEVCGKTFTFKSNLNRHIVSVHNGIRRTCDLCGKKFNEKSHLDRHIESVHNGATYSCDICRKTFTQKVNLRIHIDSVHNGVKYACDMCAKTFAQKGYLKMHIDAIHNGINHSCDRCGKKFLRKKNLERHTDTVHSSSITT